MLAAAAAAAAAVCALLALSAADAALGVPVKGLGFAHMREKHQTLVSQQPPMLILPGTQLLVARGLGVMTCHVRKNPWKLYQVPLPQRAAAELASLRGVTPVLQRQRTPECLLVGVSGSVRDS